MFGKNYDEEIKDLKKCIINQDKRIDSILDFMKTYNKWFKDNGLNELTLNEALANRQMELY